MVWKVFLHCTGNDVNHNGKSLDCCHIFHFARKNESQFGFFPIWILIKFPTDEYFTIEKYFKFWYILIHKVLNPTYFSTDSHTNEPRTYNITVDKLYIVVRRERRKKRKRFALLLDSSITTKFASYPKDSGSQVRGCIYKFVKNDRSEKNAF